MLKKTVQEIVKKQYMCRRVTWTTDDEIDFVTALGYWSSRLADAEDIDNFEVSFNSKFTRIELLEKYLDAAQRRDKWGGIKKQIVIGYVENLINNLKECNHENGKN